VGSLVRMRSLALTFAVGVLCACTRSSVHVSDADGGAGGATPLARARGLAEPRVSAQGSDLSDLPELFPDGDWLAIDAPLLDMSVYVAITVGGEKVRAMLDTGATTTTMSRPLAVKLGLIAADAPRGNVRALDAHGSVIYGDRVVVEDLTLGRQRWENVQVTVLGEQEDLFLVGADVLRDVDLYIAGDEGLVGVFAAGRGPRGSDDRVVKIEARERQLIAVGDAPGKGGPVPFRMIVDTGAWNTSVPLIHGINGGLPADTAFESITVAVGGEQENRGRFVLEPLSLGGERVPIGRVLAIGSTLEHEGGMGLLGNDVLMRGHTVVSFANSELRFVPPPARPAVRMRGPGGQPCRDDEGREKPCLSVRFVESAAEQWDPSDLKGVCLEIHVDKIFANQTLELAITGQSGDLFNGGAIRAFVTANDTGAQWCAHVWKQLDHLGVKAGTPASLRWVRTEGVRWPCDPMKTRCITFTGPLAKLLLKN
jgi:gag-polyprotein putative aspartyl protease